MDGGFYMNGLWWLCPLLLGALLGWLAHWLLDWLFTNQWRMNVKANHATMTGQIQGLTGDLGTSRARLDERNVAFASLERETVDLRARAGMVSGLESEIGTLKGRVGELEPLQGKLSTLEGELGTWRGKYDAVQGFEAKYTSSQSELDGLRARITTLEPLEAKVSGLEKDLGAAKGEAETARNTSKKELNDLSLKFSDAEGAQLKLKESLDHSVREIGDVRRELDAAHKDLADARVVLDGVAAEREKYKGIDGDLEQSRSRLGDLERELNEARASVSARDGELTALRKQHDDHMDTNEIQGLRSNISELQPLQAQLEGANNSHRESSAKLEARIRELEGQTDVIPGLRSEAGKIGGLETRIRELEGQNARIAELEAQNARIAELEARANRVPDLEKQAGRIPDLEARAGRIPDLEKQVGRISDLEKQANRIPDLEKQVGRISDLEARANRIAGLETQNTELQAEIDRIRSEKRDDLTKISGIGAVFAKRLNESGIHTCKQLHETNDAHILEIIKPEDWQKIEPSEWREDSGIFAAGGTPAKRAKAAERLARINGIGDVYERKLNEAGIRTFAELAATSATRAAEITGSSETESQLWITEADALANGKRAGRERERLVRGKLSSAEEELEKLRSELSRRPAGGARRDLFEDLPVIGEAYQRRLYGAGIFSFEELAALTPARLHEIIGVDGLDYELVLREAAKAARGEAISDGAGAGRRRRRQRDSLERINGIGVVYQRKLFAAGIDTFEDLIAAGPDKLYDVLEADLEYGPWITEAQGYASNEAQYRDHLEKVDGIGQVYQGRLFEAGVYSFEDLAAQSDDRIREIVQPGERDVEIGKWKLEALELAKTSPKNLEE
jgi:predicted flap endonuclease-1-like 5' DNA nuclease